MEGMSSATTSAKNKYNKQKNLTNARTYFNAVIADSSTTDTEKKEAALAYKTEANIYTKNNPNEDAFATSAHAYYVSPTAANAKAYYIAANNWATPVLKRIAASIYFNATILDETTQIADKKTAALAYQTATANDRTNNLKEDAFAKSAHTYYSNPIAANAKAYYIAANIWTTPALKRIILKLYYDTATKSTTTNSNIKFEAALAYYNAIKPTPPDVLKQCYTTVSSSGATSSHKFKFAKEYYEAIKNTSLPPEEKLDVARNYYLNSRKGTTASGQYKAAKEYYSSAIDANNKIYYAAYACYITSTGSDSIYWTPRKKIPVATQSEIYTAALNLLDYIEANQTVHPYKSSHMVIAQTLYNNSPDNQRFDSAKRWYDIAQKTNSPIEDVAKIYYNESKKNNISCKNKCLATKARYNNGGKTDTNVDMTYNYYVNNMGSNCEIDASVCSIVGDIKKEGFVSEGLTCQNNTQSELYKSAKHAYTSYDIAANPMYTKLSTVDLYFGEANKPDSGLNTADKWKVAEDRLKYIQTMKYVEPRRLLAAANDYYVASLALDCGSDISNNQFNSIKTYYEIASASGVSNSDKYDLSKKYYDTAVGSGRSDAEKYKIAKIWFANSQLSDSGATDDGILAAAKAVYQTAMSPNSGATDLEKYNATTKYRDVLNGRGTQQERIDLAKTVLAYSTITGQTQSVKFDAANSAYSIMTRRDGFTDFTKKPTGCECGDTSKITPECSAYCAYDTATTTTDKLQAAEQWSGMNYKRDIVEKRKEMDVELSKLTEGAQESNAQKMGLDATIMVNIAATVLASSLIVFSITKL
jgi:hypothetical protein